MTHDIKMDSKGRIQIPKELREELHIIPGQNLKFRIQDGNLIILKPITNEEFIQEVKKFHNIVKNSTNKPIQFEKLF